MFLFSSLYYYPAVYVYVFTVDSFVQVFFSQKIHGFLYSYICASGVATILVPGTSNHNGHP